MRQVYFVGDNPPVLLAIDQGTTGTTCLVVGDELDVRGRGYAPVAISTPRPG
jgi:sugar (pentulose or hexulose) kinase